MKPATCPPPAARGERCAPPQAGPRRRYPHACSLPFSQGSGVLQKKKSWVRSLHAPLMRARMKPDCGVPSKGEESAAVGPHAYALMKPATCLRSEDTGIQSDAVGKATPIRRALFKQSFQGTLLMSHSNITIVRPFRRRRRRLQCKRERATRAFNPDAWRARTRAMAARKRALPSPLLAAAALRQLHRPRAGAARRRLR